MIKIDFIRVKLDRCSGRRSDQRSTEKRKYAGYLLYVSFLPSLNSFGLIVMLDKRLVTCYRESGGSLFPHRGWKVNLHQNLWPCHSSSPLCSSATQTHPIISCLWQVRLHKIHRNVYGNPSIHWLIIKGFKCTNGRRLSKTAAVTGHAESAVAMESLATVRTADTAEYWWLTNQNRVFKRAVF